LAQEVLSKPRPPFKFKGTIDKTEIDIAPTKLSAADIEQLQTVESLRQVAE
jgi:hypothetical protein